jgi:hypothetical protein
MQAMMDGLKYVQQLITKVVEKHIVIRGDSSLIINFMRRKYVPKKRILVS